MVLKTNDQIIVDIMDNGSILILKQDGTDCRLDKNDKGEYYVAMTGKTPKYMMNDFINDMRWFKDLKVKKSKKDLDKA